MPIGITASEVTIITIDITNASMRFLVVFLIYNTLLCRFLAKIAIFCCMYSIAIFIECVNGKIQKVCGEDKMAVWKIAGGAKTLKQKGTTLPPYHKTTGKKPVKSITYEQAGKTE